jgi:hypothetical protein
VLAEPIAQALLFFVLSLAASGAVVLLVGSRASWLGVLVRAATVFVIGLLLWLGWSALDAPAWGGVRIGAATWPLGVLATITGATALSLELLARRMQLAEPRSESRPGTEPRRRTASGALRARTNERTSS